MLKKLIALITIGLCLAQANAQLRIGQTVGLTGINAPSTHEMLSGAKLYIDAVNARGGVHGQMIELISLDDKFDPKLAAENARILIEEKNVLAMFLGRGTPHTEAVIPFIDKAGVPYLAPSTGAMSLHQPVKKHIFHVRTPYQNEVVAGVKHLHTLGLTRIAVVHVDDSFGEDGLAGVVKGFAAINASPLFVEKYDRVKPVLTTITARTVDKHAQAIVWIGNSGAIAEGLKEIRAAGSSVQMVALSVASSPSFVKQLGDNARGMMVTQAFPGERSAGHPFVSEALVLARTAKLSLTPFLLEGFAAAKVLVEALNRTGRNPTREKLQRTLENFRPYDLGGKLIIEYTPTSHTGLKYVDMSIIAYDGRFVR